MRIRDRGEATVETVLVLPALLLVLLVGLQIAVRHHAANVATGAAARAAAVSAASAGDDVASSARRAAEDFVTNAGGRLSSVPEVSRGVETTSVAVTVHVPRLLPWVSDRVTRTAVEPIERFIPEIER